MWFYCVSRPLGGSQETRCDMSVFWVWLRKKSSLLCDSDWDRLGGYMGGRGYGVPLTSKIIRAPCEDLALNGKTHHFVIGSSCLAVVTHEACVNADTQLQITAQCHPFASLLWPLFLPIDTTHKSTGFSPCLWKKVSDSIFSRFCLFVCVFFGCMRL